MKAKMLMKCHLSITITLLFSSVMMLAAAEPPFRFENYQLSASGFKTGLATIPSTDRRGVEISWQKDSPAWVDCYFSARRPEFSRFDQAEFSVELYIKPGTQIQGLAVRLADCTNEMFQYSVPVENSEKGGLRTFRIPVDLNQKNPNSWGGNNDKKANWPLKLAGFSVVFGEGHGEGELILDSADWRIKSGPLKVWLAPYHPLNLLLSDSPASFRLNNPTDQPATITGRIELRDGYDHRESLDVNQAIPANGSIAIALPGDFSKQNIWYLDYRIQSSSDSKELVGSLSFARMIPAGPTPGRGKGFLFGIVCHAGSYPQQTYELLATSAGLCGAKIVRECSRWWLVQPKQGVWDFSVPDGVVDAFARNGIELQSTIGFTPGWAFAKDWKPLGPRFHAPPDSQAFGEYVKRHAEHYKGRIHYYEIWNEPDFGNKNLSPDDYLEIQRIAYEAIKSVDPDAKVMNGGITGMGPAFDRNNPRRDLARRILTEGRKTHDIFAFHAHGALQKYIDDVTWLEELQKSTGNPEPWYPNETAISSASIGELRQAETLVEKVLYSWSRNAIAYNWYCLRDTGYDPKDNEQHFGLLTGTLQPKMAYLAFNMLAAYYTEAEFRKAFESGAGNNFYLFRGRRNDWLLPYWNSDYRNSTALQLLANVDGKASRIDLLGNETPVTVHHGLAFLTPDQTPATLRLAGTAREPEWKGTFFDAAPLVALPGKDNTFQFRLHNPLDRELDVDLKFELPSKLSSSQPGQHVRMAPGKTVTIKLPVAADHEFRSYVSSPERLKAVLSVAGSPEMEIFFPVESALPVETKYPAVPTFSLDRADQVHEFAVSAGDTAHLFWQGPEELSAKVYLARDSRALKLKVVVKDDRHFQPNHGSDVWSGDNIQFALHLPNQPTNWEIGLTRLSDGKPEVFAWHAPAGYSATRSAAAIPLKTERDETTHTTTYEAEIPFAVVGLSEQIGRAGFRFNLIVNDNDGEMREHFIRIAPGMGGDGKTSTEYPFVVFR